MIDEQETIKIRAIQVQRDGKRGGQHKRQDILRLISAAFIILCIAFALFLAIQLPKTTEMWNQIIGVTPTQISCVHVLWVSDGQNNSFVNDYHCSKGK